MKQNLRIKITGKVQGVYYRASMKKEADRLGVKGFVKNEEDRTVIAEIESDPLTLKLMVNWCQKGSEQARVNNVFVEEVAVQDYASFEIK